MRLSEVEHPAQVRQWLDYLDGRWPGRAQVAEAICGAVEALERPAPRVLELCCGAGMLAERLLERLPGLSYTGIDNAAIALEYAQACLTPFAGRYRLLQADLNGTWPAALAEAPPDAVVSMQALHDLGEEAQVARAYRRAADILPPGGLLLNADLIEGAGEKPGRMLPARHLELLEECGLERVECTLDDGTFALCKGYAPR